MNWFCHSLWALALLAPLFPLPLGAADQSTAQSLCSELSRIFEQHRRSVVRVYATDNLGVRVGSGFFIDPSGLIYTHAGTVMSAEDVKVSFGGRMTPAQVVTIDERNGVAILKVDCASPFIPIGDSDQITNATPVILIGFPEDYEVSSHLGMIAARERQHLGKYFATSHFRANMAVQRGEGGAPVLNLAGEVIGILMARIGDGSACHILPIRAAEKTRQDISRFGELRPGWVGGEVEDAAAAHAGSTAQILTLGPGTPAAQGGLKAGDVILSIDGIPVTRSEDVLDAAYFLTAGDLVEVRIQRDGETRSISVKPTTRPVLPVETMALGN